MSGKTFASPLADRLLAYVELQRALGFRFEEQLAHLHAFDQYLRRQGGTPTVTQELAIAFATGDPDSSWNRRARRYQVVRRFAEYLTTFDPRTPILDPKALPRPTRQPPRHILTDEELARVLHEAQHVSPCYPVCGVTIHAMVGLAASTGLRISEVVRLDKADADLQTGVLLVRRSKFGKDRYVPVHPTTLEVLRGYAAVRDAAYPDCHDPAFFLTMWQKRFVRNTLQQTFCKLARRVCLRGPRGRGLSFHSLRHRFAVKRLVAWYRAGVYVQAMLPALATYMGHVHYSDTAYYLTATAELMGLAADRHHGRQQEVEP